MAGSSLAAPDAAGWVTDFLDAAYYARPAAERDVADLRLAYGIVHTRWDRLGRRLRIHDAIAFHRAFGVRPLPALPAAHASPTSSCSRARRGCSATGSPTRGATRRAAAGASRSPTRRRGRRTSRRTGCATRPSGALRTGRAAGAAALVDLPGRAAAVADAAIATLSDTSRWPDFGCAGGRFTALRSGGLRARRSRSRSSPTPPRARPSSRAATSPPPACTTGGRDRRAAEPAPAGRPALP